MSCCILVLSITQPRGCDFKVVLCFVAQIQNLLGGLCISHLALEDLRGEAEKVLLGEGVPTIPRLP